MSLTDTGLDMIIASTGPFCSISDEPFACYSQFSGPVCLRSLCNHRYQLKRKWAIYLRRSLHAIRLLWQINHLQYIRRIMHKARVLLCFVVLGCRPILPITIRALSNHTDTVYHKKYAHGFVVLCFVVVMQLFIMNSHEVFIHIHQDCFAGTGAIVRLPQCQWSKPDGYGKISQCITTTKHSKAKTVCIFLGIYCIMNLISRWFMNVERRVLCIQIRNDIIALKLE